MRRSFTRFVGIALGGGRGKTTAVAELRIRSTPAVEVTAVALRADHRPWTDETLVERLGTAGDVVLAFDAPLTGPACNRCVQPTCPGMEICADPAVAWLRTEGRALLQTVSAGTANGPRTRLATVPQARLAPWSHRATDLVMTYRRGLLPIATLGHANGPIAARAGHLRRRLRGAGFALHENLVEVSPAATIAALCGPRAARGYKRDADPWRTRAAILEQLGDLTFAPTSRMAREEVLQNDHGFDAVIAGYTAFLWARDGWHAPHELADDGWVFAPPEPHDHNKL